MTDSTLNSSMPWPPEMRAKFGNGLLPTVAALKRAQSREEAEAIVKPYGLTVGETVLALRLSPFGGSPQVLRDFRLSRGRFYAAAWSVGAAYRQIARILRISHQTVHTAAGKLLGPDPTRVSSTRLTDEQVETLYLEWQKHSDLDVLPLIELFLKVLEGWDSGD